MHRLTAFRKYLTVFSAWLTQPAAPEEITDPSRLAEALLPVSQLYGFEMSWLRARRYGEK